MSLYLAKCAHEFYQEPQLYIKSKNIIFRRHLATLELLVDYQNSKGEAAVAVGISNRLHGKEPPPPPTEPNEVLMPAAAYRKMVTRACAPQ
jgi:hypothetical protein